MATNLSFANSLYQRFLGIDASTEQRQALTLEIATKKQESASYTEFNATADFANNRFDTKHPGEIAAFITDYYNQFNQFNHPPSLDELLSWAEQSPTISDSEVAELKGFMIYDIYALSINNLPQSWEITLPATSDSINENQQLNYTVAVTNTAPQSIKFSLADQGDSNAFNINAATGQLTFQELPDFEEKSRYTVTVFATDTETAIDSFTDITISIYDVNEPPQFTSATSVNVAENTSTAFYTAQATDPEGDNLTFAINNPADKDNGLFKISPTGALSFITAPDFESDRHNYLVDIILSDGSNPTITQELSISITDVNERNTPVLTLSTANGNSSLTVIEGGIAEYKVSLTSGYIAAGETLRFTLDAINGVEPFGAVNPDDFTNFIDLDTASYTFERTYTEAVAAGATIGAFSLATTDDTLVESQEQFAIKLSLASINNSIAVDTSGSPLTTFIIDNDINQSPIAVDDQFITQSNQLLANTVAANDTLGNTPSSYTPITTPAHGLLTLNVDGSFEYTPTPEFTGTDSFSYQITDIDGEITSANVAIEVATNKIPLAVADSFSAIQNQAVTLSVASNDNLGDLPSVFSNTTSPANGSLQFSDDGSFTYTPIAAFVGTENFDYQITDANGETSTATATIAVLLPNSVPVAVDDLFSTNTNQAIINSVASNDSQGDTPTIFANITSPAHGSLLFNNDGSFTYTPNIGYAGSDSFDYQITDIDGETDTATVSIVAILSNNTPIAVNDSFTTNFAQSFSNTVTTNDNLGDTPSVFTNTSLPTNGTISFNSNGSFSYIPNIGFSGTDSFLYQITDVDNETASGSVTINVLSDNNIPFANGDEFFVLLGSQTLNDNVASNDNSGDTPSIYTNLTTPVGDSFIFNNDGSFTYTSSFSTDTTTSFDYQITDAEGDIDIGTTVINAVANLLPPSFTFTTATDTLTGDTGSNFFSADNTLTQVTSVADSVNGDAGTDYLIMTVDSANDIIFPGTVQNIEKLEISGSGNNLFEDVDFSPLSSISSITLADFYINGSGNRTLTLGAAQALTLENIIEQGSNGGDTLDIAQDNSQTSLNLTVNELGQAGHQPDINLEGTALTTLNLSSTGTSSQFNLQQTGTKLDTINISGNQDITLTVNFFNASTSPTLSIDTTANTASTESIIRFNNHILDIMGGAGFDKFSIEDTDTFDGGAGTDSATFNADVSATNLLDIDLSNVEKIFVDGFNANTFDFSAQTEGLDIEVFFASGGNNEMGATIIGSSNNDLIQGSFNNDTFTGGLGADNFGLGFFNTAGVMTSDTITDFSTIQGDSITSDSAGYRQQNISFLNDTQVITGANLGINDTFIADSGLVIIDNGSVNIINAPSLTTTDVANYLSSFENSTGIDKLTYENTNSIFYVVVSNGIDTGIYEADANGNGDTVIDANELTLIGTLTGINDTGSISASFIDFLGNVG